MKDDTSDQWFYFRVCNFSFMFLILHLHVLYFYFATNLLTTHNLFFWLTLFLLYPTNLSFYSVKSLSFASQNMGEMWKDRYFGVSHGLNVEAPGHDMFMTLSASNLFWRSGNKVDSPLCAPTLLLLGVSWKVFPWCSMGIIKDDAY